VESSVALCSESFYLGPGKAIGCGQNRAYIYCNYLFRGGKNIRNLNVASELEVVARRAARCRESTQYSRSLQRGVSLG
jgi:hypothetical protein